MLVLPALMVTLGSTEAEAQARARRLEELASPEFRWQNALYTAGLDPDAFDPALHCPRSSGPGSRRRPAAPSSCTRPRGRGPALRCARSPSSSRSGAGQMHFVGTPEQLADAHDRLAGRGRVDGFTIMGSTLPYELATFADQVVPHPAAPRPVPHRVHRPHAARPPRASAACRTLAAVMEVACASALVMFPCGSMYPGRQSSRRGTRRQSARSWWPSTAARAWITSL